MQIESMLDMYRAHPAVQQNALAFQLCLPMGQMTMDRKIAAAQRVNVTVSMKRKGASVNGVNGIVLDFDCTKSTLMVI